MSTGAECNFTEFEPGRWKYWLQEWPYGDNPDGVTYGPFRSYTVADQHLRDSHANPGGSDARIHPTGHVHEFGSTITTVPTGRTVTVDVESLGPDATDEQIILLVQSLPADHRAFQVRAKYGMKEVQACLACGAAQECDHAVNGDCPHYS